MVILLLLLLLLLFLLLVVFLGLSGILFKVAFDFESLKVPDGILVPL